MDGKSKTKGCRTVERALVLKSIQILPPGMPVKWEWLKQVGAHDCNGKIRLCSTK